MTAQWLAAATDNSRAEFIESALNNTDKRVAQDKPVTPMFMFGVLLWGPVRERANYLIKHEQMSDIQALVAAAGEMSAAQNLRIAVPKRFSFPMREILQMQPRFERRKGKRAQSLIAHRRFRAAYDLMLLRVVLGEVDQSEADWWTEVQELPENQKLLQSGESHQRDRPRNKRPRSRIRKNKKTN
jgi:poly(A) polymerase